MTRPRKYVPPGIHRRIRMDLAEELMGWLNSVDTSEMTAGDVHSTVYHKLMEVQ